jgi:pimeloyl-ACP methyl ester carboxylesterase
MERNDSGDADPASCSYISQGLKLHYLDWRNESAPLLILVHGLRDHARSWDWTARALRDRWHIVAPDLRGHGDSQWSPDGAYLLPYHIMDLTELIHKLGDERLAIVAHSLGGSIASRCAALLSHRVNKLALIDGLGPSTQALDRWSATGPVERMRSWVDQRRDNTVRLPRRFATLQESINRMKTANPRLSDEQARHLAVHGVRHHPDGYAWKFDPLVNLFPPEEFAVDGTKFWREILSPTLLLYGTESWTSDPEADGYPAHFREHRIVRFEGAGHWLHHDRFDAFIAALGDFL